MDRIGAHAQGVDEAMATPMEPDYLRQLRGLMVLVDRAMADEGVPPTTRDRVVSRVLHGTPTQPDTPDWADVEPEPQDLAVVDALAAGPPGLMHGGASVQRTLAEERADEDAWLAQQW